MVVKPAALFLNPSEGTFPSEDESLTIASSSETATQKAMDIIKGLTEEAEIGRVYDGVVKRIAELKADINSLDGKIAINVNRKEVLGNYLKCYENHIYKIT